MLQIIVPINIIAELSVNTNLALLGRLLGLGAEIEESNEVSITYKDSKGLLKQTMSFNTLFYLASIGVEVKEFEGFFKLGESLLNESVPTFIPNREIYETTGSMEENNLVTTIVGIKKWNEILLPNYTYVVKEGFAYFSTAINGYCLNNFKLKEALDLGFTIITIKQYKEETYEQFSDIR